MSKMLFQRARYVSSHTTASMSKWFVGSSSSSSDGCRNRARARAIRIRQPPEKSRVFLFCIATSKPRPCRIDAARFSAVSASSSSKRS
mmetsp:Transcript_174475/g.424470  ORF Transcript_174475/g.424470 Transcript_174475/m.424470 type:complete len:88 (+) Transcript_174475:1183-1446(+)